MVTLHSQLEGAVNVYTMDHRGTGRSTLLDPSHDHGVSLGTQIDPSEVPACAQDLHKKYGDLASFSVTTAATDLVTFISTFTNGANTTVYGASYDTILALAPLEVTGYVLDGIATSSGAPGDEFLYMSKRDIDFGEVGDALLSLREQDIEVKARFEHKSLNRTLDELFQQFDKDPNATCASLITNVAMGEVEGEAPTEDMGDYPPSYSLRLVLGSLFKHTYLRTLIPPVIYRLQRCEPEDVDVLSQFGTALGLLSSGKSQDDAFHSTVLYSLIIFSEKWETPSLFVSHLRARYESTKMSDGGVYPMDALYCAFSKEKSAACDELNVGNYDGDGIVYKPDQYWNKTAAIPSQASVLLLSGKLDQFIYL